MAVFSNPNLNLSAISFIPQIVKIVRIFRITRLLKLITKAKGLAAIVETIMFSVPSLVNVFALLMIFLSIFSVMGCSFFPERPIDKTIDMVSDFQNFDDFLKSMLTMLALSTGENWNSFMYQLSSGPRGQYYIVFQLFWIFEQVVIANVMINLFILVIIEQFEKYYLAKDSKMQIFKRDQACFMVVWKEFTLERYNCFKIKENQLTKFFRKLGETGDKNTSLGFPTEFYDDNEVKKSILKMGIKSDNGFIYFNEMLYRSMRRRYGNHKIKRRMQVIEFNNQYQIYLKTLELQQATNRISNEDIYDKLIKKANGVNPFLAVMNFKITFKTWYKHARIKNVKAEKKKQISNVLNSSQESINSIENDFTLPMYDINIDYEEEYMSTSEEDNEEEKEALLNKFSNQLKVIVGNTGKSIQKKSQTKKKDFVRQFEKAMKQRFSDQLVSMRKKIQEEAEQQLKKTQDPVSQPKSAIGNILTLYHINLAKAKQASAEQNK